MKFCCKIRKRETHCLHQKQNGKKFIYVYTSKNGDSPLIMKTCKKIGVPSWYPEAGVIFFFFGVSVVVTLRNLPHQLCKKFTQCSQKLLNIFSYFTNFFIAGEDYISTIYSTQAFGLGTRYHQRMDAFVNDLNISTRIFKGLKVRDRPFFIGLQCFAQLVGQCGPGRLTVLRFH